MRDVELMTARAAAGVDDATLTKIVRDNSRRFLAFVPNARARASDFRTARRARHVAYG
jgi:hypothetical protein